MTTIDALLATISGLRSRREALSEDLWTNPAKRGTTWYDDRVREVEALGAQIQAREDMVFEMEREAFDAAAFDTIVPDHDDISDVDTSIGDTLDAHEIADGWAHVDTSTDDDETIDLDASRRSDREGRELRTARIAIIAGLASAREWGSPLGAFHTS